MKALVYTATETIDLRDLAMPEPSKGQSLIAVSHCGICGSDMHAWHGKDPRRVPPLVLGHEAVGTVIAGGMEGARVAINPLMTCGDCHACATGREHLCPQRELIGMRVPGAFAEYVAIDTRNLTPLPDDLPFARAALAEPLACALHSVRIGFERGQERPEALDAVVLGGGAIGLLAALVLRAQDVRSLRIAEPNAPRRRALDAIFPGAAYDPTGPDAPLPGETALVIDAVGSGRTRQAASALVAPGGVIVHVGLQDSAEGLDTRRLTLQEVTLLGSYCYTAADFAAALAFLRAGVIDPDGWSEIRGLATGAQSFRDIDEGRAPAKIILAMH
jgi:threonine dehydrogenase-like Zn-dependent dehydrogenase